MKYITVTAGTATYTGVAYSNAQAYSAAASPQLTTIRLNVNNTAAIDMNGLAHNKPRSEFTIPFGFATTGAAAAVLLAITLPGVSNND